MKNTRFIIRMNASRHDITDVKHGETTDLSNLDKEQLGAVAHAVNVVRNK